MVGSRFGEGGFPSDIQSTCVVVWLLGCTDPPLSALMLALAS